MAELSFIIPTYNRKNIIADTVFKIKNTYPEVEIVVVDDGSIDNTEEEFKKRKDLKIVYLKNQINQGKGVSLRKGFEAASGKYLIFTDDDLPYGIEGVDLIIKALKDGHSIVMAERDRFYDNLIKKIGRKVFNIIFKTFLGVKIKDTQAGLKGFSQETGKKLFALSFSNRFAIDLEIVFLCQKLHYPIQFVSVHQKDTNPSSLSFSNLFYIFLDTLKIKFHHYELS
ncbi:MAG: glycosyltransferase family 2 protein [Minisyncoccia bacterium]